MSSSSSQYQNKNEIHIKFDRFRIPLIYKEERRGYVVQSAEPVDIEEIARNMFNLDGDIRVFVKSDHTRIKFTDEVLRTDELEIECDLLKDQNLANGSKSEQEEYKEIDISEIKDKSFTGIDLLQKVNDWANIQLFKVIYKQGYKGYKNHINRTLECSENECKFKLMFHSKKPEGFQELTKEEQDKTCEGLTFLLEKESSKFKHNHLLNYTAKDQFTKEIISEIDMLKGKMKTNTEIQNFINKKYSKNFNYSQIANLITKLMNENFGNPSEDAHLFIEEIKKDEKNGAFNEISLNQKTNQLEKILYISKNMFEYKDKFLDVVFVDSTYKRNRFNMPVVNILGINNFGRNILLGFALVNEETTNAYDWLFKMLKKIWKKEPNFFVTDESQAIINGTFLFLMKLT